MENIRWKENRRWVSDESEIFLHNKTHQYETKLQQAVIERTMDTGKTSIHLLLQRQDYKMTIFYLYK